MTTNYDYPDHTTLMSITDTQGNIRYVNHAFAQVSGYPREALLGQPHNVVRHPDMPKAAFADMWNSIQSGETWTGMIKNLRANGLEHYWVRANVTPIREEARGDIIGYMSVRVKPTEDEILEAQEAYASINEGERRFCVKRGVIFNRSLAGRLQRWFQTFTSRQSVWGGVTMLAGISSLPVFCGGASLLWLIPNAATALAVGLSYERQIIRPLRQLRWQTNRVAGCHVERVFDPRRIDEMGLISRAVNQCGLNILAFLGDISHHAHALNRSGRIMEDANQALSVQIESVQNHLDYSNEISQQIMVSIEQNAHIASTLQNVSQNAKASADQGYEVIGSVHDAVTHISDIALQIGQINTLVDRLSQQTNLLALNAAVEAARAGPAGRGFAVVSAEVRTLAQQSAQAATQIQKLVENCVQGGKAALEQTNHAKNFMTDLIARVGDVDEISQEMAQATKNQNNSIQNLANSIRQIENLVRQNTRVAKDLEEAVNITIEQKDRFEETVAAFDRSKGY